MTGRKQELNLQLQQIIDGVLLIIAFWGAHQLRYYGTGWFDLAKSISPFEDFQWVLFVLVPFGPIILDLRGYYLHPLQKTIGKSLWQLLCAAGALIVMVGVCILFFKFEIPSRAVLLIFAALATGLLTIRERLTIAYLKERARSGRLRECVILAGLPADVRQLRESFTPEQLMEMDIVGETNIETDPTSELIKSLHEHSVSRVIFAGGHGHLNRLQEAIAACEIEGVEAWLVADFIKTSIARPDFDTLGTRPMLVFRTTPDISWALWIKSLIDRFGALGLLFITSPFFILAAIGIKLTSPGPIIFTQKRGGRHGKPFTMFKFRSMNTDAEMRHAELQAFNQMSGPVFKVQRDPRVTKFGKFLRKTSIDELPQLINVLQGNMSLVGPRPLPVYEVQKFDNTAQRRRLSVKPGLTCLWQVSGRNQVMDFQEWVKLDLEYIDNWSIWLDLVILLKTIPAVLSGSGAK